MEQNLRVGACSLAMTPGDIDANLERIKDWCSRAIEDDVRLLLFPELSLSGYWLDFELYDLAQPRDGSAVSSLVSFLEELDTDLIISVGLAEKYGGCIYNTQILLDGNGERYYYRKTHWPPEENSFWSLGNAYPVHMIDDFIVGTAICFDNNFPEVHRIYGLQGTDLVLAPYAYGKEFDPEDSESIRASIYDWKNREKMYLRASAAANYHWIVASVGTGPSRDYKAQQGDENGEIYYYPGVILFINPEGKVVLESSDDSIEEQLLWYDIDLEENIRVRKTGHNHFKNRRTATYERLTKRP